MEWTKERLKQADKQAAEYYRQEELSKKCTCALTSWKECPSCRDNGGK